MFGNYINNERLIHAIKTAIACCAAYLFARVIGQPADQWVVISVIVVMCSQLYVGGIMQKSYLRVLGTLMGCLTATATILFLHPSFLSTLATIALASFMFSYIATSDESLAQMGTLGAVTTIIIMFGNPPSLSLATMRFAEISIGIVIAAVVSQFIFPIHARTHLRRSQAGTLAQIRDYYSNAIINRFHESDHIDNSELEEIIIKSMLKQRQLAKEAAPELIGKRFDPAHFSRSLYCEREILRAINFMDMALSKINDIQSIYSTQNPFLAFNQSVIQALDVLVRALRSKPSTTHHVHLPDLALLIATIQQRSEFTISNHHLYIDGFVFSAEILITNLRELAVLNHVPVTEQAAPV